MAETAALAQPRTWSRPLLGTILALGAVGVAAQVPILAVPELLAVLTLPGYAVARLLRLRDPGMEAVLGIGLSVAGLGLISLAQIYTGGWNPRFAVEVTFIVGLLAVVADMALRVRAMWLGRRAQRRAATAPVVVPQLPTPEPVQVVIPSPPIAAAAEFVAAATATVERREAPPEPAPPVTLPPGIPPLQLPVRTSAATGEVGLAAAEERRRSTRKAPSKAAKPAWVAALPRPVAAKAAPAAAGDVRAATKRVPAPITPAARTARATPQRAEAATAAAAKRTPRTPRATTPSVSAVPPAPTRKGTPRATAKSTAEGGTRPKAAGSIEPPRRAGSRDATPPAPREIARGTSAGRAAARRAAATPPPTKPTGKGRTPPKPSPAAGKPKPAVQAAPPETTRRGTRRG